MRGAGGREKLVRIALWRTDGKGRVNAGPVTQYLGGKNPLTLVLD